MVFAYKVESNDKPFGFRSGHRSLWEQYLSDALKSAKTYKRAAGFLSSSVFDIDIRAWIDFFRRDGLAEIVCSPHFSERDMKALYRGLYQVHALLPISFESLLPWCAATRSAEQAGQRLLAWAIAHRRLDVWIAKPRVDSGEDRALYHEKFSVIESGDSAVALCGSANESRAAYLRNFERMECYFSAVSPYAVDRFRRDFDRLKNDTTPSLKVVTLSQAFAEHLLIIKPEQLQMTGEQLLSSPSAPPEIIRWPRSLQLRPYQSERVDAWFTAGGKGLLSVATGGGKTLIALACISRVYEKCGAPLVAVVVVPYIVLLDQWAREMRRIGLNPIQCCGARNNWEPFLRAAIYQVNAAQRPVLSVIVTNATFSSDHFQDCLKHLEVRTILVADEVHNLGARHLRDALPEFLSLRLGLSATPDRFMDSDGTKAVDDYFFPRIKPYTLQDALSGDPSVLCQYYYYPVFVELTETEAEAYMDITKKLARILYDPEAENLSSEALSLLLQRARIAATAANKIDALIEKMHPYCYSKHNLIYCGDGSIEIDSEHLADADTDGSQTVRQVDQIVRSLELKLKITARPFTHRESRQERQQLLEDFTEGRIQSLVAIRCLDEGVDVPMIERAFILASSTNPRQFIQRRGRVLRKAAGKQYAEIYDFLVLPPLTKSITATENRSMHHLILKELDRALEFARYARNRFQAQETLLPLQRRCRDAIAGSL
jgi:superfamily II DNA or RNA helicase